MTLQYLMDENVDPVYALQLRRQQPDLVVWAVGEPNTPPKSTLDPEILLWCEANNFILVTNNRTDVVFLINSIPVAVAVSFYFKSHTKMLLSQDFI